jgi:hypothetical protein
MAVTGTQHRISLSAAAQRTNLTSQGLLKILRRTGYAIRDDGRWYVHQSIVEQIAMARRVLARPAVLPRSVCRQMGSALCGQARRHRSSFRRAGVAR